MAQELSTTLEDYLEAIYHIELQQRVVRPRDICRVQNVVPSTVTAALQSLAEKGFINYEPHELITLTDKGWERGKELDLRHNIIRNFLENILGLPAESADANACRIEHVIDEETRDRFICFLAFLQSNPLSGKKWVKRFQQFIEEGTSSFTCEECMEQYIESMHEKP